MPCISRRTLPAVFLALAAATTLTLFSFPAPPSSSSGYPTRSLASTRHSLYRSSLSAHANRTGWKAVPFFSLPLSRKHLCDWPRRLALPDAKAL
ncbi:hypothetical protein RRG08_012654 [Elysia crispata]|uniref:Secreted protein n=1 Tax=Elysia crispata TaxID=231223 RepID=A0AAE0YN44_9GAST|nr:hypothetical protein RRG08_012654 [Elysia crispata]